MKPGDLKPILFIAGPTASGKSASALQVAEALDGEIINADAMQIYRDLRVLTARPSDDDLLKTPHHLYGTMEGKEQCSAGIWARAASEIIIDVQARSKIPIVAGGTGLYYKALEEGLSPIPDVPEEIRAEGQALFAQIGPDAFWHLVISFDPAMERLATNDRQRLIRAWEVYEMTGMPLSQYQALPREPLVSGEIKKCLIAPPREHLYRNCDQRFDAMLENGAVDEVETLLASELDPSLPLMKSLGVPELASYLAGEITLDAASERAKRNTRRFAKRQMTWFKGQAGDWPRIDDAQEAVAFFT